MSSIAASLSLLYRLLSLGRSPRRELLPFPLLVMSLRLVLPVRSRSLLVARPFLVQLIRSDGQGNLEWCRHSLGSSDIAMDTKICIKPKRPGFETCGTRHQGEEMTLEPDALL
jgi:hypothetical protein